MNKNKVKFIKFVEELKEQENIDIYDVEFLEEYWGEEKDKRMHFKVKGLKNWKWGAWLTETEENPYGYKFEVFCQYERFIYKFKPSRGIFSIEILPVYEYNENGEKYMTIDLWELARIINFIKKHSAMAYCYGDNITKYNGEWWARWHMFRDVSFDMWYDWSRKACYRLSHAIAATFSFLRCMKVIYCPDRWNDTGNVNDDWIIYPINKIGRFAANRIKKLIYCRFGLGSVTIEDTEEDMMWSAYSFAADKKKYPLNKTITNEDGTFEVDDNELWAMTLAMENDDVIQIYGEL